LHGQYEIKEESLSFKPISQTAAALHFALALVGQRGQVGSWLLDDTGRGHPELGVDFLTQAWATLSTPGPWIGAAAGVLIIYAAIRLRRYKDEG
jgi:hypothetical protein